MKREARELLFLGYVGTLYEIDGDGRVWRIGRRQRNSIGINPANWSPGKKAANKKYRAEQRKHTGYLDLSLSYKGKKVHCTAHRLVYRYFNGPIPEGMVINHINGTPHDNRPSNLEAVSQKYNQHHAAMRGRYDCGRLPSDDEIISIRHEYKSGRVTLPALAEKFGITKARAKRIVRGEEAPDVGGPITSKQRRLTAKEKIEICQLYRPYKYSMSRLAKRFHIGEDTIYRTIKKWQQHLNSL